MNREVLFRGKRIDNGGWVEGYLTKQRHSPKDPDYSPPYELQFVIDHEEKGVMITSFIDPATMGQYTGMLDKNRKRIFEGDIVIDDRGWPGIVTWLDDGRWMVVSHAKGERYVGYVDKAPNREIIGNIHDKGANDDK